MRYLLFLRRGLILVLLGTAWLWAVAGAAFCPLLPLALRAVAALLCVIVPAWTWRRSKQARWRPAGLLVAFLAVTGLLLLTRPQIDRPWEADQQQLSRVEVAGNHVLIHHVRDIKKTTDDTCHAT